jgi:hypothetical protein
MACEATPSAPIAASRSPSSPPTALSFADAKKAVTDPMMALKEV